MAQGKAWEKEYRNSKLLSLGDEPQAEILKIFKRLKKLGFELYEKHILDLGSGTGRNANYVQELGNSAVGIEISETAVREAQTRAKNRNLETVFIQGSIGEVFPFEDNTFDLTLDITTSNSLSEKERENYLKETQRVLKPGGYLIVRALAKDGDENAKYLLKNSPGPELDTYYMKDLDLIERVFTKEDFIKLYSQYFSVIDFEKVTHYARMNERVYKRNYFLALLQKTQ